MGSLQMTGIRFLIFRRRVLVGGLFAVFGLAGLLSSSKKARASVLPSMIHLAWKLEVKLSDSLSSAMTSARTGTQGENHNRSDRDAARAQFEITPSALPADFDLSDRLGEDSFFAEKSAGLRWYPLDGINTPVIRNRETQSISNQAEWGTDGATTPADRLQAAAGASSRATGSEMLASSAPPPSIRMSTPSPNNLESMSSTGHSGRDARVHSMSASISRANNATSAGALLDDGAIGSTVFNRSPGIEMNDEVHNIFEEKQSGVDPTSIEHRGSILFSSPPSLGASVVARVNPWLGDVFDSTGDAGGSVHQPPPEGSLDGANLAGNGGYQDDIERNLPTATIPDLLRQTESDLASATGAQDPQGIGGLAADVPPRPTLINTSIETEGHDPLDTPATTSEPASLFLFGTVITVTMALYGRKVRKP